MNKVIYQTKAECQAAINTMKAIGMEPLSWQLDQLKAFEDAENERSSCSGETPIWDTLQANYPYGIMPQNKKDCVEQTVLQLLEDGEHAEEPGLLLGKIQCGKTDTFEDIIGLSFDKGVDIAIVITKGTKALVNQTIKRMKHDYRFFKPSDRLHQASTIEVVDIMNLKGGLKQTRVESSKIVIVCKKNARNLSLLISLFKTKSPFLRDKKVIIVDDEADFASRNYRSVKPQARLEGQGEPALQDPQIAMAKISEQIDEFRTIPGYCRYLQVTATPYCLYLQPDGRLNLNGKYVMPFKPRFTSVVPVHDKYIGGKEYFEDSLNPDSMYSHLFHAIDQKCIDVMGHEDKRYLQNAVSSGNIYGLTYALVAYFMAVAVRRIQERQKRDPRDYKTSAVIHVEINKKNHSWQKKVIDRLIEDIKVAVVDGDQSDLRIHMAIESIYDDFLKSNEKGQAEHLITVTLPEKEEIMEEIRSILSPACHNYAVQPVNSDEEMSELLDEDTGELKLETAANIFIGGSILDRGVTIKNMLCFFYGRDPRSFQQDTVLQHARMYGSRSKEDMAVMRFHTTPRIHRILSRMNDLDNQLRERFEKGIGNENSNAVFVGYDKDIKPCAMQKIKASNALTIKPNKSFYPIGFWTGSQTAIGNTVNEIDRLIVSTSGYPGSEGDNAFFEMASDKAFEILSMIESTFVYDKKYHNEDRKSDLRELMCALQYCLERSGGKMLVLHRTNRNMTRIRANGSFMDAPMDGKNDLKPSKDAAVEVPVLMLLRQNGNICRDEITGENIGWNNAPFYWPVLVTQGIIDPAMFAIDQTRRGAAEYCMEQAILEGIDPSEVLQLTFKGDLEDAFGHEGDDIDAEETRSVKETTAARYLQKDEKGNWKLNPAVPFDQDHDHGLYSLNNGIFPFIVRPYKYMLLRNSRDANADKMLLLMDDPTQWRFIPEARMGEHGELLDRDSDQILSYAEDNLTDRNLKTETVIDNSLVQWIICFHLTKVLRFIKGQNDLPDDPDGQEGENDIAGVSPGGENLAEAQNNTEASDGRTMHALCLRQPWASLLIKGIKDVECCDGLSLDTPETVLIYADKHEPGGRDVRYLEDELSDMGFVSMNEIDMGNLPVWGKMPRGAFLGYVTLDRTVQDYPSCWSESGKSQWVVKDPFEFDEPLPYEYRGSKLFQYSFGETGTPTGHYMKPNRPWIEGTTAYIPVNRSLFDDPGEELFLELTENLISALCVNSKVHELPFLERICLMCHDDYRYFKLKSAEVQHQYDINNDPIVYEGYDGTLKEYCRIVFQLGTEIE